MLETGSLLTSAAKSVEITFGLCEVIGKRWRCLFMTWIKAGLPMDTRCNLNLDHGINSVTLYEWIS